MTITEKGRNLREELNEQLLAAHCQDGQPERYIRLDAAHDISLLMRRATRYANMQEQACGNERDRKESKLEQSIRDIVDTIDGVKSVVFTGDPRGYCVKLILCSGRHNTWGGGAYGWGIA